jgi:hypothetical protein
LDLDKFLDQLFHMLTSKEDWGKVIGQALFEVSLRSNIKYVTEFAEYILDSIKPKRRRKLDSGESSEILRTVLHILVLLSRELKKDRNTPAAALVLILPDFVSKLRQEHMLLL